MKNKKRRYIDFQDIAIFTLALIFLLIIFVGILALSFPVTAKQLIENASAKIGAAAGPGQDGWQAQLRRRAEGGYKVRIKPITGYVAKLFNQNNKDAGEKKFSFRVGACYGCHADMFDRTVFNKIVVDHRLHDAQGLQCADCHGSTKHPKPPKVAQATCISCHKSSGGPVKECAACHPAGTILAVASSKDVAGFVSEARASRADLVPGGFAHPAGEGATVCGSCHDQSVFCAKCHGMTKDHQLRSPHEEGKWRLQHGPRIMQRDFTIVGCANCHTKTVFCSMTCHPNPNRDRRSPRWPVPRKALQVES